MTDAEADPAQDGQPTVEQPVIVPVPPSTADERPELTVGAAFAGGFVLALLLKRLAR